MQLTFTQILVHSSQFVCFNIAENFVMSKRKSGSNEGNKGLLAWLKKGKSENKSHGNVTKSSSADTAKETETKEEEKETFIITEAATEPTLSLSPSSDSISNVTVSVVTNASYSDTKSDGK